MTLSKRRIAELLLRIREGITQEELDEIMLEMPYIHNYVIDLCLDDPCLSVEGEDFLEKNKTLVEELRAERGLKGHEEFFDEKTFVPKRLASYIMSIKVFRTDPLTKWVYVYNNDDGIYSEGGENIIKSLCESILDEAVKNHYVEEVMESIRRSTFFKTEEMNPPGKICLQNGILDIPTKELTKHSHDIMLTVKIPINYDPEAKCPNFLNLLRDILGSEEDILAIQELFGYCLYKKYSIKKAFMLHGETDAGKTVLINQLIRFLGGEMNISAIPIQRLRSDFRIANLEGKLANICDDMGAKAVEDTGNFKQLTGDSMIEANIKYVQRVRKFRNFAKMIFACNKVPPVDENTDDAYYNRIYRINFPYRFVIEPAEPNEKLRRPMEDIEKELDSETELSGMLNWALDGLERLLNNQKFTGDKSIDEKRAEYAMLTDPTMAFKETCLSLSSTSEVLKDDIYLAFIKFCMKNRFAAVSNQTFFTELKKIYSNEITNGSIEETRPTQGDNRKRAWRGIEINESLIQNNNHVQPVHLLTSTFSTTKKKKKKKKKGFDVSGGLTGQEVLT